MIHPIYIVNIYLVTFTFNRHFGFVHSVIHSTWERENKTTTVENSKLILAEVLCCWCECDHVFHVQFANKVFIRLLHFSEWNSFYCFFANSNIFTFYRFDFDHPILWTHLDEQVNVFWCFNKNKWLLFIRMQCFNFNMTLNKNIENENLQMKFLCSYLIKTIKKLFWLHYKDSIFHCK